jgi:hypothetical protein
MSLADDYTDYGLEARLDFPRKPGDMQTFTAF